MKAHVKEHYRQVIWYSLDNGLFANAVFIAERLVAEDKTSAESRYILATSLQRLGKHDAAMRVLQSVLGNAACAYIFAQCCVATGKSLSKGEAALERHMPLYLQSSHIYSHSDRDRMTLPDGPAAYCILGHICAEIGLRKKAVDCYVEALRLNPFLWVAFEALCRLGVNLKVKNIYKANAVMKTTRESTLNKMDFMPPPIQNPSVMPGNPFAVKLASADYETPTTEQESTEHPVSLYKGTRESPSMTPLEYLKPARSRGRLEMFMMKTDKKADVAATAAASGAPLTRRSTRISTNSKTLSKATAKPKTTKASAQPPPPIATSTRKLPPPEPTTTSTYGNGIVNASSAPTFVSSIEREEAETDMLLLLSKFAEGYDALTHFRLEEAKKAYKTLPADHCNTAYTMIQLGRTHFEFVEYEQAVECFQQARQLDPDRLDGMEIYSTALWHLRKDIRLSYLAHELLKINHLAPQSWCAVGNCFSLLREHDQAIKAFQRSIHLDPRFTYAYTLLGHEYMGNEEYDKARTAFRNALRTDKHHYNAWYGLGMLDLKIGKYEHALEHFMAAAHINSLNVVLLCCIGLVYEKLQRYDLAREQYEIACRQSSASSLARYKRAKVLVHLKQFDVSKLLFCQLLTIRLLLMSFWRSKQ